MRRGIERDVLKGLHMSDLVHALGPGVLAGHDVAAEIDGDGVFAVHAAFLAEGFNRPLPLDRGVELIDPFAETKGVRILDQRLKY